MAWGKPGTGVVKSYAVEWSTMEQTTAKAAERVRDERVFEEEEEEDEDPVCPLCIEELDATEIQFRPCPCGYRVCLFCYERIKLELKGICPSCRSPYGDPQMAAPPQPTASGASSGKRRGSISRNGDSKASEQGASIAGASLGVSILGAGDHRHHSRVSPAPPILASSEFPTLSSSPPLSVQPRRGPSWEKPRPAVPPSAAPPFLPPSSSSAAAAAAASSSSATSSLAPWASVSTTVTATATTTATAAAPPSSFPPLLPLDPPQQPASQSHVAPSHGTQSRAAAAAGARRLSSDAHAAPSVETTAASWPALKTEPASTAAPVSAVSSQAQTGKSAGRDARKEPSGEKGKEAGKAGEGAKSATVASGGSVPAGRKQQPPQASGGAAADAAVRSSAKASARTVSHPPVPAGSAPRVSATASHEPARDGGATSVGNGGATSRSNARNSATATGGSGNGNDSSSGSGSGSGNGSGSSKSSGGGGGRSRSSSSGRGSSSDDEMGFSLSDQLAEMLLNSPGRAELGASAAQATAAEAGEVKAVETQSCACESSVVRTSVPEPASSVAPKPSTSVPSLQRIRDAASPHSTDSSIPLASVGPHGSISSPSFSTWLSPHSTSSAATLSKPILSAANGMACNGIAVAGWASSGGSGLERLQQLHALQRQLQQAFVGVGWSTDEMQRASEIVAAAKQSQSRFSGAAAASAAAAAGAVAPAVAAMAPAAMMTVAPAAVTTFPLSATPAAPSSAAAPKTAPSKPVTPPPGFRPPAPPGFAPLSPPPGFGPSAGAKKADGGAGVLGQADVQAQAATAATATAARAGSGLGLSGSTGIASFGAAGTAAGGGNLGVQSVESAAWGWGASGTVASASALGAGASSSASFGSPLLTSRYSSAAGYTTTSAAGYSGSAGYTGAAGYFSGYTSAGGVSGRSGSEVGAAGSVVAARGTWCGGDADAAVAAIASIWGQENSATAAVGSTKLGGAAESSKWQLVGSGLQSFTGGSMSIPMSSSFLGASIWSNGSNGSNGSMQPSQPSQPGIWGSSPLARSPSPQLAAALSSTAPNLQGGGAGARGACAPLFPPGISSVSLGQGMVAGSLFAILVAVAFHQHHFSTVAEIQSLLQESRDQAADVDTALRDIKSLLTNPSSKSTGTQASGAHLNQQCILAVDRGSINASLLADTSSPDYLEDNAKHLPSWLSSQLINQLYAQRHGYTFYSIEAITPMLISEGIDPNTINRIAFINRQLACCCRWVLALVDGGYIRLEQHSLPVEHWLARLAQPDTFEWITRSGIDMANQTWFPSDPAHLVADGNSEQERRGRADERQEKHGGGGKGRWGGEQGAAGEEEREGGEGKARPLIGLVGRSGDGVYGLAGKAGTLFHESVPFVGNAAVLLTHSGDTFKFLSLWQAKSAALGWDFTGLQAAVREFATQIAIVPHLEMGGLHSRAIRYAFFGSNQEDAEKVLATALLAAVKFHQAWKDGNGDAD
ncbi:unnamed protein product [Closterium sp. Yama58-4]|nr:unnamed protein product [Closterium sp. Yama58-4]